MIALKVYYNVCLLIVLLVSYLVIPMTQSICLVLSGICLWNIFEGLTKKKTNLKVLKTPFSSSLTPFASRLSACTSVDYNSPLHTKSNQDIREPFVPLSKALSSTPISKKYEQTVHTPNNSVEQYPKEISDQQVTLIKIWIVTKILRPFVKDFKLVSSVYNLEKIVQYHSDKTIPFGDIDDIVVECQEEHELHSENKWILKRLTYEQFLQVPSTDQSIKSRKYLIRRLFELAQHSQMINYCSDSRKVFQFEATFPTDGQIILHFVDMFLKINAPYHSQSIMQYICIYYLCRLFK